MVEPPIFPSLNLPTQVLPKPPNYQAINIDE